MCACCVYGPDEFHPIGFYRGFMGYNFKVIVHNSDPYLININEKEIM